MAEPLWKRLQGESRVEKDRQEDKLVRGNRTEPRAVAGDPVQAPVFQVPALLGDGAGGAPGGNGGRETFDIIGPGHTYESVTEKIGSLVLTNRISLGWLFGLAI